MVVLAWQSRERVDARFRLVFTCRALDGDAEKQLDGVEVLVAASSAGEFLRAHRGAVQERVRQATQRCLSYACVILVRDALGFSTCDVGDVRAERGDTLGDARFGLLLHELAGRARHDAAGLVRGAEFLEGCVDAERDEPRARGRSR